MLGCCAAILLARRGVRVTLFDLAPDAMSRTGRWNEGKIHLGFLYAADPSLATARNLIPSGVAFRPIVESLIESSIEKYLTREDEIYLAHEDSIVDADTMFRYFTRVHELIPDGADNISRPAPLNKTELANVTLNPRIVAGYRVPERSVNTRQLADHVALRVKTERLIELKCNLRVLSVADDSGRWSVRTQLGDLDGFDVVINALWEGRTAVDATVGKFASELFSYRYRVALFGAAPSTLLHNVVIATGPFGDVKSYGDDIYLSWYPAGLLLDCRQAHPPVPPNLDNAKKHEVVNSTIAALGQYFPKVIDVLNSPSPPVVAGGWVVARGEGSLADPRSTLHRRDKSGFVRRDGYYSVDTCKYSLAPWLASQIVEEIAPS
jgi:glycine/D-amino acid oxidase-like deaminating enzyme